MRKKSSRRIESRRAYQKKRNQRRLDDAKKFRDLESRIAAIEKRESVEAKPSPIVIVLDSDGKQLSSKPATVAVGDLGPVGGDDSSSSPGALRLKTGESLSVTTSVAGKSDSTELIGNNASVTAVVASPEVEAIDSSSSTIGAQRLKTSESMSVTSSKLPPGHQHPSANSAPRLKTRESLSVTSSVGVQSRLRSGENLSVTSERLASKVDWQEINIETWRDCKGEKIFLTDHQDFFIDPSYNLQADLQSLSPENLRKLTSGGMKVISWSKTTRSWLGLQSYEPEPTYEDVEMEDGEVQETEAEVVDPSFEDDSNSKSKWREIEKTSRDVLEYLKKEQAIADKKLEEKRAREKAAEKEREFLPKPKPSHKDCRISVVDGYFPRRISGKFMKFYTFSLLEEGATMEDRMKTYFPEMSRSYKIFFEALPGEFFERYNSNIGKYHHSVRHLLSRPPYISIDSSSDKDKSFLSALVYLYPFNDKFIPNGHFSCPLNGIFSGWLHRFCSFRNDLPKCNHKVRYNTKNDLYDHIADEGKGCKWHRLILMYMDKVFFKDDYVFVKLSSKS